MSFFKKLFGGASFEDERRAGDEAFEAGRFPEARIAYERALDSKKDASAGAASHCETRMHECLDRMAEARLERAEELLDQDQLELAAEELQNALELAKDEAIQIRARRRLETMEQEDARQNAEIPEEMTDEDRWAILAGNWEPAQLEEYDEYGEEFREALLAIHDERVADGLDVLEDILLDAEDPLYLWLEVGRARAAAEDFEGAEEALREFADAFEEDEGGEAQLAAYVALASLREREDDEDGAIAELSVAMEQFPNDPRPFLIMGRFLRGKGHAVEAAEVLELGRDFLDEDRFDWRYYEELGLAQRDAGEAEHAAMYLDRIIAFFVSIRRHDRPLDYPPASAIARAELFEEEGRLEKAADLYRSLAEGSDKANHMIYHREAGRLLVELDLPEEARRMYTRALALADDLEDGEEAYAEIEAILEELE